MPMMDAAELTRFMDDVFPQSRFERFTIEEVRDHYVRLSFRATESDLRPGGTVAGTVLMALADTGVYLAVLAMIGPVALAVTTSLNINFLRKPQASVLRVETRLLKLGQRLAVGDVSISSDDVPDGPVAHATCTYSIPPR